MKYEKFDRMVGRVRARAGLGSREAAVSALRAVLTTFGERILASQAHQLAAQLPRELGVYLERTDGGATRFGLDELLRRVAARERVRPVEALHHTRAVIAVLHESVAPGAFQQLRRALPRDEFAALFEEEREHIAATR